ncbi:MAG: UvrD-helicase domain-containing protein [Ktedonobacterales bacterium]
MALPAAQEDAPLANERRIFGPPGTGKTTYLAKLVEEYTTSKKYRPSEIFITSFTRTAAAEIASRGTGIPQENIQTLHAAGYRALGGGEIAETHIGEWNQWVCNHGNARLVLSMGKGESEEVVDSAVNAKASRTDGDRIFSQYMIVRAQCQDIDKAYNEVRRFHKLWSEWKDENDYIDFQDMIELPLKQEIMPNNNPKVIIGDEFQDFTTAEANLARFWGKGATELILAGDDDQCHPGYVKVLTPNGYVPIEVLDPEKHRVVSYDRPGAYVVGLRDGYAFKKAYRHYEGMLYHILADGKIVDCTSNHRFIAKWSREACEKTHVVYLMRKGDRYRIGWCKLFNVENSFHLGQRARLEDADAAWILHVTDNRTDASVMESVLSTRFGIPTVTFREVEGAQHMTNEAIDRTFTLLQEGIPGVRGINLRERAEECLEKLGRDINYPIWTKQKTWERRGGTSIMEIEAVNMISDLMLIPSHQDGTVAEWCPIKVTSNIWAGTVYSLDVEKYHLYIANGLVTHNCLYHFKGASADNFIYPKLPEGQMHVLAQSYRVPRAVQAYAERWIRHLGPRRQIKEYLPRDSEGEVRFATGASVGTDWNANIAGSFRDPSWYIADAMERYVSQGKRVMFLASCAYMLDPLKNLLRKEGIPFHNPYRTKRIDWNPLNAATKGTSSIDRLLAFLRPSTSVWGENEARIWTIEDFRAWTGVLGVKGVLRKHGESAAAIERYYNELVDTDPTALDQSLDVIDQLAEWMNEDGLQRALDQSLDWFEEHLLAAKKDAMKFPLTVARKHGGAALRSEPDIILGTIHSVKGGAADVVYLFPDISPMDAEQKQTPAVQDSLVRLFYVGMTRARESLVLCNPASSQCAKFPKL